MKNFIGSGKRNEKFAGIVSVTLDLEKCKEHIYEYNGKKYLTFDVAEKREADQYGKTHSVSVWTPDEKKEPAPSQTPFNDDEIPF